MAETYEEGQHDDESRAPLRRELVRLRRAARLFWLLFVAGILSMAAALVPALARPGFLLFGFGMGLVLAAFLLRNTHARCVRCDTYIRAPRASACPHCNAALSLERL